MKKQLVKTTEEIKVMRVGCKILADVMRELEKKS
jgi:Xaa-Pro aminopeptidase